MKEELEKAIMTLDNYCNETDCEECEISEKISCKGFLESICDSPYRWD